jgi:hypothetical protein
MEEPEKSLRDYASPRCEDIRVQESDSKLEVTKYEIKSKIIEMVAANPFEGMVTENPYRHIRHFTTLCNTVRQEGVPDEWFKWNLFPYSLAGEAKTWYSFASFEVEGNWNKMTKKFCEKLFLSYGPPWAHYLCGYQDRLLGGPLGLLDLRCTAPDGVKHKDYGGEVLG